MNVTVTDVLGSLFNPTDTVCFRIFDDKKGGVFQGSKLSCECGKYKSIEETLKNHNAMNRGIFFVVNYGGQDDESITRINAQFVEMDNDSFDEQQKKIDAFPLPPSMVMKTQKSYHVYWFMLASRDEQLLLRYRYLDDFTWEEIARMLNVSLRTVHRIHGSALQNFIVPD